MLLSCCALNPGCSLTTSFTRHAVMPERKRSVVWSYITAVNENAADCDVCRKAVHYCGSTTNVFEHTHKKKAWERDHGAAAEKKGGAGGGGGKCLISTQNPPTLRQTSLAESSERQGISRYVPWNVTIWILWWLTLFLWHFCAFAEVLWRGRAWSSWSA